MHPQDHPEATGIAGLMRRPSFRAVNALALAVALFAVPLVLSAPVDASETDRIAAWMVVDASSSTCQSLVTFKPNGTDLKVVVDCEDNDFGILTVAHVAWSPDGSRIAFNAEFEYKDEDGNQRTDWYPHVVNSDGGNLTRICADFDCTDDSISLSSFWNLSWGADDHLYLSAGLSGLYRVSMQDGATEYLDPDSSFGDTQVIPWNVELSPDGTMLALHDDFSEVVTAPLADLTKFSVLTEMDGYTFHTTWHPLGTHVVYVDGDDESIKAVSITAPFQTTVLLEGDTAIPWPRSPSLSPDGSRMVFFDKSFKHVYVVALTGDDRTPVRIIEAPSGINKFVGALDWFTPPQSRQVVTPAAPTTAVACSPMPAQVGATVTCSVTGGDPGIDIWWRASYNPVFAEAGVKLDADGNGTFSFVVPAAARGQEVMVELVEWTAPMSIGVAGSLVPTSIPAGEGRGAPSALLILVGGLVLLVGAAARRRVEVPIG